MYKKEIISGVVYKRRQQKTDKIEKRSVYETVFKHLFFKSRTMCASSHTRARVCESQTKNFPLYINSISKESVNPFSHKRDDTL